MYYTRLNIRISSGRTSHGDIIVLLDERLELLEALPHVVLVDHVHAVHVRGGRLRVARAPNPDRHRI